MKDIKVGDKNVMAWPFYIYESFTGSQYEPEINEHWCSGCAVWYEQYCDSSGERFFACNAEGNINYEVMAVCNLAGRYQDRIIVKVGKVDPDGGMYGRYEIKTLTKKMYLKHINSKTPFRADYDVDENLNYSDIQKRKGKGEIF